MVEQSISLPVQFREAAIQPSTLDEEERTVELVWTTGAKVKRFDLFDGLFEEELSLEDEAVRLDRLNNGAALLDSHNSRGLSNIIGVVEKAWIEGKGKSRAGHAKVRFSKRADADAVFQDVKDRVIRNVSVGYAIHRAQKIERKDKVPVVRATDWEPMELSLVGVPADAGAQIRSDERTYSCVLVQNREDVMDHELPLEAASGAADDKKTDTPVEERKQPEQKTEEKKQEQPLFEKRDFVPPPAQPVKSQAEIDAEIDARVQQRMQEEAERQDHIRTSAVVLGLGREIAERFIKAGTPAMDAGKAMLAEAKRRNDAQNIISTPVSVTPGEFDEETIRGRAMMSVILHRYDPQRFPLEFGAESYVGYSLLELARMSLEKAGVRTAGFSKSELAKRSMIPGYGVRSGLHTTSDFGNVLADVANKTLRAAYDQAIRTFAPFCRRTTAPDFKTVNRVQLGEAPTLIRKNEHGEFQRGTIGEAKESYALVTYGRVFGITREVVVNDDLGAFTRMPAQFGAQAAQKESDIVWATLLANAAMGDGTALFHANHGNLKASGSGAPSVTTIGANRAAMSKQLGLDGRTIINVMARYLLVPPELETVAEQLITGITPATTAAVVPASMRTLIPISEPRLSLGVTLENPDGSVTTVAGSATAWYLAADPGQFDTIEYAYLEGEEGVSIDSRVGFDVDGVEVRARLDFAAKPIDWRGLYKDVGTA